MVKVPSRLKVLKTVRTLLVAAVLAFVAAVPLSADTKYSIHIDARPAPGGAKDPLSQMAGGMLVQMFPAGGLDQSIITGERGTRAEQKQAFAGVKAGTITLIRPDGTIIVVEPASKTFWKQPATSAAVSEALGGAKPDVKVTKRGEFETINGMKAEHLTLVMAMKIPGLEAAQLPPGMALDLSLTCDVWLTDAIKAPGGDASLVGGLLKQFGLGDVKELGDGRLMVKGVLSALGLEIVMTTGPITSEDVPASMFDVPADYKEVPAPIK